MDVFISQLSTLGLCRSPVDDSFAINSATTEMHLLTRLQEFAKQQSLSLESLEFATYLDTLPEFHSLRSEFQIPSVAGRPSIYMVGNSLGPQPKDAARMLQEELEVWGRDGHEGHFKHQNGRPWLTVDEECADLLLPVVGAMRGEVAAMASLTANLHLLMCAFYQPTPQRHKIIMESRAFPSDHVQCISNSDHLCSIWWNPKSNCTDLIQRIQ